MRARLGPAGKLSQDNFSMRQVLNDSGLDSIKAHEAKPAQDLLRRKNFRQLLFIAEAVLQRHGLEPFASPTPTSPIAASRTERWKYALSESFKAPAAFFLERRDSGK